MATVITIWGVPPHPKKKNPIRSSIKTINNRKMRIEIAIEMGAEKGSEYLCGLGKNVRDTHSSRGLWWFSKRKQTKWKRLQSTLDKEFHMNKMGFLIKQMI